MDLRQYPSYFEFKDESLIYHLQKIHPYLLMALAELCSFCHKKGYPIPIITRGIDYEIPGVSVSDTHSTARALDISVSGWNAEWENAVETYMNGHALCKDFGAVSVSDGAKRLILVHNVGFGTHFHLQIGKFLV